MQQFTSRTLKQDKVQQTVEELFCLHDDELRYIQVPSSVKAYVLFLSFRHHLQLILLEAFTPFSMFCLPLHSSICFRWPRGRRR
mmetsp:Transcript_34312/g.51761  ORF Transcript_34312/g.51761 Transcript_34312/m.51761 type:complete len:84 (-) Transcript_34312:385-636(-)